ncbi:DUF2927 domain-containing protein [Profundibacterium mesophilum]|uniref:DUF2927 domain-containing protein n=1 Tax=Profundibacterium mesophilum TaxID=1258573 RepID=UPI003F695832
MRLLLLAGSLALASCAPVPRQHVAERGEYIPSRLPPMKTFTRSGAQAPERSNSSIANDFLDLSFQLESGRTLPVFTRFEGPVTVRVTGNAPASLDADLTRLLARLRTEAGIDITRIAPGRPAGINIELVTRTQLQRAVPQAACFVVPRVASWAEFRRNRRGAMTDWTTLRSRERMSVFIPRDVSPQEVRDCLHEEMAQALGPLNDLYHLTDSVFNDDNFHTVLTGFDMLILRATYAPELRSGMTRADVAATLPGVLARLNPKGAQIQERPRGRTSRAWINAIEGALGPQNTMEARQGAAKRAVHIAGDEGWDDNRLAFSLFALGRLSLGADPELALNAFLKASNIYASDPSTVLHEAHIAMQLAAFALSSDQAGTAIAIVDRSLPSVRQAENAALLGSLLLVKSEALDAMGRPDEAARLRRESLGWARYGFGTDAEVRKRAGEIAALNPNSRQDRT